MQVIKIAYAGSNFPEHGACCAIIAPFLSHLPPGCHPSLVAPKSIMNEKLELNCRAGGKLHGMQSSPLISNQPHPHTASRWPSNQSRIRNATKHIARTILVSHPCLHSLSLAVMMYLWISNFESDVAAWMVSESISAMHRALARLQYTGTRCQQARKETRAAPSNVYSERRV